MPFQSITPPWQSDERPVCPKCEREMRLVWIAANEQLRYSFECALCDIELEVSDVSRDRERDEQSAKRH
jgi:hypothetical protein